MTLECRWCGYEGKTLKAIKPRPSTKRTRMCPACFGDAGPVTARDDLDRFIMREATDVE